MNINKLNIWLLISVTLAFTSCTDKRSIVFKKANIIPMTKNTILENTSIHVFNGEIIAIGNFENFDISSDTLVINAENKYLTPGFSDMHVHINNTEDYSLFIANGITHVRNMWEGPRHLESRSKVKNKEMIGPEVFTTGPITDIAVNSSIWSCPTLTVRKNIRELKQLKKHRMPELKYVNPETLSVWENYYTYPHDLVGDQETLKALHRKGSNIVSGTDTGNPYVIAGFSLHQEFENLKNAGLTPYEILQTTTINSAKMLKINHRAGTIEIGKDADLVLLYKNPLEEISNTKTIAGIMIKGRWFHERKLNKMLNKIEESFKKKEEQ